MDLKYYQRKRFKKNKKESQVKMETELNTFIPLTPAKLSQPPPKLVYHRRMEKNKSSFSSGKISEEKSSVQCLKDLSEPPPEMESEDVSAEHKEPKSFESCISEELEPLSRAPTLHKLGGFEVLQTATDLTSPLPEESSSLLNELEPLSQELTVPELGGCGYEVIQTATDPNSPITEESSSLLKELEPLSQELTVPELGGGGFMVIQTATDPNSPITEESSSLLKELKALSQELTVPEVGGCGFECIQTATDPTSPITEESSSRPKELEPLSQELTVPELGGFEVLQTATQESSSLPKELEPLSQEPTGLQKVADPTSPINEESRKFILVHCNEPVTPTSLQKAADPTSPVNEESRKFILVHCNEPVTPGLRTPKQKFKKKRRKHVPKVLDESKKKKKTPKNPPKPKKTNSMLKEKNKYKVIPTKSVRVLSTRTCRRSLQFETIETKNEYETTEIKNGNNGEIIDTGDNVIAISTQDCQNSNSSLHSAENKLGIISLEWKRKKKRMTRHRKVMLYSILWSAIPRTLKTYQPCFLKKKKRSKLSQQQLNLASTTAIFPLVELTQNGTQVRLLQSQNLLGADLPTIESVLPGEFKQDTLREDKLELPAIESEVLLGEFKQDTLREDKLELPAIESEVPPAEFRQDTLREDKLEFFINEFLCLNVNESGAPVHYSDLSLLISPKIIKKCEEKELAIVPYLNSGELATIDSKKKRKKKKRPPRHELPVVVFDSSTLRQLELIKSPSTFLLKRNGEEDEDDRWEYERKLFATRIESFTAKMKYMQGDRSFKPWKGSVVDSIVGVYLTQNVSDALSSNVYMQLLAKFPVQTVPEDSTVSHGFYMRSVPPPLTQGETETVPPPLTQGNAETKEAKLNAPQQEISILEAQLPKFSFPSELSESSSRKRTSNGDNNDETRKRKKGVIEEKEKDKRFQWERLRSMYSKGCRSIDQMDSADWEAVRCAKPEEVSDAIHGRGQHTILAMRIQNFLNLVVKNQNGSLDLEWLRNVPTEEVKEFLMAIDGLGLKSVECLQLLALQNVAFPVDVNVARITVRLGWVPLQPLPGDLQFHALEEYPILDRVQEYLWPRLRTLNHKTLYELHYQMITFGKVFCTKRKPNCKACPMKDSCHHYESATRRQFALPRPPEEGMKNTAQASYDDMVVDRIFSSSLAACSSLAIITNRPLIEMTKLPEPRRTYPIVELSMSPEHEKDIELVDIEAPDREKDIELVDIEAPEREKDIELVDIEDMALDCGNHASISRWYKNDYDYKMGKVSDALVNVLPSHYSIPMPKVKDIADLRTVHLVFEIPDNHPVLREFERHEPDDAFPYLLAIWSPGETESSMDLPVPSNRCSMGVLGAYCEEPTCYFCNKIRQQENRFLRGTILIPCRTAMRGSFPLNGTYFQVKEVFADDETSKCPIEVPWDSLKRCRKTFVCIGSSATSILKGLTENEIRSCFVDGFMCVRGFNRKTRQPKPLSLRLHAAPSKRAAKKRELKFSAKNQSQSQGEKR